MNSSKVWHTNHVDDPICTLLPEKQLPTNDCQKPPRRPQLFDNDNCVSNDLYDRDGHKYQREKQNILGRCDVAVFQTLISLDVKGRPLFHYLYQTCHQPTVKQNDESSLKEGTVAKQDGHREMKKHGSVPWPALGFPIDGRQFKSQIRRQS